ncbi:Putrescine importer PuuP [bioreactor metagenome]|uniref:Putrescine importer PuuP n=1 Tax=bioreactor metagenome TaxID=1076179 RepID=A0A645HIZ0_9ZZZZ
MTHGMLALAYVVATIAMLFTALSYGRMSAAYPIAGSAYSYTQRSINPHIGFLSGWAILMDYLLLPMICCLLGAIFFAPYFPNVPSWVWIVLLMALSTIINFFGVSVTARVNNTVILLQIVFAVGFIIFIAKWLITGNGAATFFDASAILNPVEFNKPDMGWGVIFTGASILALSFLGFDAVSTMAEEAINPEKNLGRATLIICLGSGAFFIGLSYLMQLA